MRNPRGRQCMTENRWFVRSIFTIGVILFGLTAVASAQDATTVSGQVKTSVGGAPLAGVIVSAPTLRVSATTDNGGNYRLVLPAGAANPRALASRRRGVPTRTGPGDVNGPGVTPRISPPPSSTELQP